MRLYSLSQRPGNRKRPGKILVLSVLLLPVLLGVAGVVIDGGLMMAAQRQAQNAADAAALAAAYDLLRGKSEGTAKATAQTFVTDANYNGLGNATVTPNIPPSSGKYAGNKHFVEVFVTLPVKTWLVQIVWNVNTPPTVTARAVAGYLGLSAGEGCAVLDPKAYPGLSVDGGGTLLVKGRVVVNSEGGGVDENNQPVGIGPKGTNAAVAANNSTLRAADIEVVGGVNDPASFQPIPGNSGSPLHCNALPEPDPLEYLPTPTTGNGVPNQFWTQAKTNDPIQPVTNPQSAKDLAPVSVSISGGQTYTFQPGVYNSINITGGGPGTVTFNPGIYVIGVLNNSGGGTVLNITTGATVIGNGVMFYNTGSDYQVSSGTPDINDGLTLGTASGNFGSVNISGSNVNFTGLNDPNGVFNGMLFYQRRWNTNIISIQGNASQTQLSGTLYAKWAQFNVKGQGTYAAQFVAGSIAVGGGANITINYAGANLGKANRVFLVE